MFEEIDKMSNEQIEILEKDIEHNKAVLEVDPNNFQALASITISQTMLRMNQLENAVREIQHVIKNGSES